MNGLLSQSAHKARRLMKIMKAPTLIASVAVLSVVLAGCGKKEQANPPTGQDQKASGSALTDAQKAAGDAAGQVKDTAQKAVGDAQKQASDATAAAQANAQGIIDQAKSLVADKKYTDALSLIQQKLAGLQLTPEQQKLVDGLKDQIQKAVAASAVKDATKTVGDLKNPLGK